MEQNIVERIKQSEKILIGLGEEFEGNEFLNSRPDYVKMMGQLVDRDRIDLKPILSDIYLTRDEGMIKSLEKLYQLVKGKDYYLITTCQTELLTSIGWEPERVVMPCASLNKKQCAKKCDGTIINISFEEKEKIRKALTENQIISLGTCPNCGEEMVINSLYAEHYDENGYLPSWENYRKWLQGTVNRTLTILEMGVNLTYPSVIRFPFEKIAFYNQKSYFVRVNEKLYQLSQELQGKGISIEKNAIDWLLS